MGLNVMFNARPIINTNNHVQNKYTLKSQTS